jgi:hypothetical protein
LPQGIALPEFPDLDDIASRYKPEQAAIIFF